jgi:ankyrin repeat protein/tetratricopeptide (TPR) repeat protein
MIGTRFEDQMKKREDVTDVQKTREDITIGSFKGTQLGFTIKTKQGMSIKQYVFVLSDGRRTWNGQFTAHSEKDLEKAHLIIKNAKIISTPQVIDSSSFKDSHPKPEVNINIPSDAPSSANFHKLLYDFLKKRILTPYEQLSKNSEVNMYLNNVLKLMSKQPDIPQLSQLIDKGKSLMDTGSDDYGTAFAYGYCLYVDKQYKEAIKVLKKHFSELKKKKPLSNVFLFFDSAVLYRCLKEEKKPLAPEWNFAMKSLKGAITKDEFDKDDSRIIYYLKENFIDNRRGFLNALKKKKEKFPWLIKLFTGEIEKDKAWAARGNKWASSVTQKGWGGFKEHLKKAREALTEAWEMHPDRPEAAALMITVAMGGGALPGETTIFWFNRAVKAEIDYQKAYDKLFWALRPRWGGNYEIMYDLGSCSLNTKRFDTKVPEYFLMALVCIATDMSGYRKGYFFHREKTKDKLNKLFEGLLSNVSDKQHKERINATIVICELLSGQYKKAQEHIKGIDKNYDFKSLFRKYRDKGCWKYSRDGIEAQIRAGLTDPDKMNEAYSLFYARDAEGAKAKLLEVLQKVNKNDFGARQFIINEIGYMLMDFRSDKIREGRSALSQSINNKNKPLFDFLLSLGADVKTPDANGFTSLYIASEKTNDIEFIKTLIDKGADVNRETSNKWTPLHVAARYAKNIDIVKFLIKQGADPKALTNSNYTPMHLSAFNENPEILNFFLDYSNINIDMPGYKQRSLFVSLSSSGKIDRVKLFLEKGANINFQDETGNTALHLAVLNNKIPVVKYLLKKQADRTIKNKAGETPEDILIKKEKKKRTQKQGKALRNIFDSIN